MPLVQSASRDAVSENIRRERAAGKKQSQAIAIALDVQRRNRASGGLVPANEPEPVHMVRGGLIHSSVPGRTDRLPMNVRPNSYVLPSDIVSGVGQGNTIAGAKIFDQLLKQGPYGSAPAKRNNFRSNMPQISTRMPRPHLARADGGEASSPIIAAGGEYLVEPETVERLGDGDHKAGHAALDNLVKSVRAQIIKHMKKLPGPVK